MQADLTCKFPWLAGLADADGCVVVLNGNHGIQITSVHAEFLQNTCLMLQTMGVNPYNGAVSPACLRNMPNGHGSCSLYTTQATHRLMITHHGLEHLVAHGFQPHRLKLDLSIKPQRTATRFMTVLSVDTAENSDTYCFSEPREGRGVFNGILIRQCTEIMQYSDHHNSVCNLASIALNRFVEDEEHNFDKLHEVVQHITRSLDHMLDVCAYSVADANKSNMMEVRCNV